jgi:hypothetical protein
MRYIILTLTGLALGATIALSWPRPHPPHDRPSVQFNVGRFTASI